MKQKTKELLEKAADYLTDIGITNEYYASKLSLEIKEYLKTKTVKPEKSPSASESAYDFMIDKNTGHLFPGP